MKVCMVTSSYPKYPGEVTAPFIEEIAAGIAALGHEVHLLLPHHPLPRLFDDLFCFLLGFPR